MEALGAAAGLPLALCLLAFGLYCCYVKHVHARYDHIPGAPRESFLFGHLPILWRMLRKQEFMHDLFLEWAEKYGPILRFNAFHRVSLMILSPEGVKEFLMSPQYPKDRLVYGRIFSLFGERFLGNGLVTVCNHEHWHKQRKIMDPAFSRTYLIGLMETFNEKAEELMEKLEEMADGKKEFSMLTMMNRVTLDIIAKVAFSLELNALSDDQTPFPHAVSVILEGMTKNRVPLMQYMPGKQKLVKEVQESMRLLRRVGKECIDQRRLAIQNGKETTLDILTQILKGDELEGTRDDENILDNFITFFIAGHETTANLLSFTVMALAQHPEILERLQAEVDEVLGAKRDINYEDLGKLTYLSQVFKESLRLYPPVPGTVRWMEKEHVINGVRIPANTTLVFSTYIMGRMERYFKDPLTFNPDRFSKNAPKPYYCYFPFSLGPRSCIGQVFAQLHGQCYDTSGDPEIRVTAMLELGSPLEMIQLLQTPWEERFKICLSLVKLLFYLAHSPLGSIVLLDFQPRQFVMVDGNLKVTDMDDASIEELSCKEDNDCTLDFPTKSFPLKCSAVGKCEGINEKKNLFNAYRYFFTYLLPHSAPPALRPFLSDILNATGDLRYGINETLKAFEKVLHLYKSGLYLQKRPLHLKDYISLKGFRMAEGEDYKCWPSYSHLGCLLSVHSAEEAAAICNSQSQCQSFIVTQRRTWTGRPLASFQSSLTDLIPDANTVVYIKRSASSGERL